MDIIILTLLVASVFHGEPSKFLKDWMPPILVFYLYEYLRARAYTFAESIGIEVVVQPIIDIERQIFSMFDEIPTVWLQRTLRPDYLETNWYDYFLFFVYSSFFWFWLVIGYAIWIYKRDLFKRYIWGLVIFSLFGVLMFALIPTAPPWYAADTGHLPYLSRILWTSDYLPSDGLSFVSTYGRNDFAAIPSMHTAWPFYGAIFCVYAFGKKFWPILLLPLVIAFATWYGAEHYVIDSIVGAMLAMAAFYIAIKFPSNIRNLGISLD